ncbi:MAG TPA: ester cyclase [Anaerolineales bacterium]|nr:ester cyclase [Anaerolineales bacterium]
MSSATNKAIVRRFIDQVLNRKQLDLFDEFLLDDARIHRSGQALGQGSARAWISSCAVTFPDGQHLIEDCFAEADRVVARTRFAGTYTTDLSDIPGTGRWISLPGIAIFRLENARIVEAWLMHDDLGLLRQLGVVSSPLEKVIRQIYQRNKGENK